MKFISKYLLFATIGALLSSCATIVSKKDWPVAVDSQPTSLQYTITNTAGDVIASGKTPQTVTLSSGRGYFKSENYIVQVKRKSKVIGQQKIEANLNGWYWGNLLFGGPIGMLIVDPLTGAMYKLPGNVMVTTYEQSETKAHRRTLKITSMDTLSAEQRTQLVKL